MDNHKKMERFSLIFFQLRGWIKLNPKKERTLKTSPDITLRLPKRTENDEVHDSAMMVELGGCRHEQP
jgi:hypothetical protein